MTSEEIVRPPLLRVHEPTRRMTSRVGCVIQLTTYVIMVNHFDRISGLFSLSRSGVRSMFVIRSFVNVDSVEMFLA